MKSSAEIAELYLSGILVSLHLPLHLQYLSAIQLPLFLTPSDNICQKLPWTNLPRTFIFANPSLGEEREGGELMAQRSLLSQRIPLSLLELSSEQQGIPSESKLFPL